MNVNHHDITKVYMTDVRSFKSDGRIIYARDLISDSRSGRVMTTLFADSREALDINFVPDDRVCNVPYVPRCNNSMGVTV